MQKFWKLAGIAACVSMTVGCAEVAKVSGELLEKERADRMRREAIQAPQQQAQQPALSYKPVYQAPKRTVCTKAGNQVSCTNYD
jgi:hypothetical protein